MECLIIMFGLSVVTHGLSGDQISFLQVAFDDSYVTNCFNQKITHTYFFIKNKLVNGKKDVYIHSYFIIYISYFIIMFYT